MRKTFTVTYPDQPYHTTTDLNNTFECTYNGPRFILVQVDKDDHQCREASRSEKADDPCLDPANFEQDDYEYVLLDAAESDEMAKYAAYMTDDYTHPDVADYEEEITDADGDTWTWNHVYEGTTGMLPHIYWQGTLLYNPSTGVWTHPTFREHVNSRESVVESCTVQAAAIDRALADSEQNFTDEERTKLTNHSAWLKDVDRKYAGINHWKWPFPADALPTWEDPNPPADPED